MTDPLWVAPGEAHYPVLNGAIDADVAIIGGGLSGIGAAHALRDSGAEVVLLEERTLASGASGRNAGFLLAGPALPFDEVCRDVGFEEACTIWRLTVENNRLMAQVIDDYGIDCGFLRRGSMSLAVSDVEMRLLVETGKHLADAGIQVCAVPREDLPRPFDRLYMGGLYYPGNGEIDPGAYVRGVARAVQATVRIFEGTPVVELHSGERHLLQTPRGEVRAGTVIFATNAYTARLLPNVPIVPRRGQVVATEPLRQVIVPFPMYANFGYQYWRQTPEGRLIVGGWRDLDPATEVGTDERLHPEIQATLDAFCSTIAGDDTVVDRRWAGIMGFSPDALPLVGPVPGSDRMYMAAGYSGHGVSLAFSCGGRVALQALGADSDVPEAFRPARFSAGDGAANLVARSDVTAGL